MRRTLLTVGVLALMLSGSGLAQTQTGGEPVTAEPVTTEPMTNASVTYYVDAEGGSDTLRAEVAAAFAMWEGVEGAGVTATESEDEQGSVVRYGDATQFGPDTVSLTLSSSEGGGENAQRLTVLINPDTPELRPAALLHETGVLIGVPASSTPADVMNPALTPDTPAELTEADRAALVSLDTFVPEDLNRDGVVDFYDLTLFGAAYGQTGVNLEGDFNDDGTVDEADLALLEAVYVFAPPSETAPATLTEMDTSGGGLSGGSGGLDEGADGNPFDEDVFGTGGATGGAITGGADADIDTGGTDTGDINTGGADEGIIDEDATGGATGGG